MGFFGTYHFDGTAWSETDPDGGLSGSEPWLWVDVYDSDFATLRYGPAGSGTGTSYLGLTPRIYFDSTNASAPTDVGREARGLVEWWASRHPDASGADQEAKEAEIASFLASDDEPPDDEPADDADIFVEIKTARFLVAMGLPLPDELAAESA